MMLKNVKKITISVMIAGLLLISIPMSVFADDATTNTTNTTNTNATTPAIGNKCNSGFLGFPAWYQGLTKNTGTSPCDLKSPNDLDPSGKTGLSKFIWAIVLNIVQIALMLVGYLSVGYIIYGGFLLMTGRGKPDEIAEGQITIRNAIIGLVISFASVAAVNFIATNITAVQTVVK